MTNSVFSSTKLEQLTPNQQRWLIHRTLTERRKNNKIKQYYPATGPLRRDLYPKHLDFFTAGKIHKERLMLAANRVGKTEGVCCYEMTLHLTGNYPDWWDGKRFDGPISAWMAGDTGETVRDILQHKMMGPTGEYGTGMIPKSLLVRHTSRPGLADAIKDVYVKHVSGGNSHVAFKSYDQKRVSFQGTEKHVVAFDEEPPLGVYVEGLMRTMTVGGIVMCTFTPLMGLSEVVMSYLPGGQLPDA